MSTEIKNTLFRFVSMRAPELSDEKKQDDRFVFREENVPIGVFDEVAEKASKWKELRIIAQTFTPLSVKEIKLINEKLTNLSIWIAKNRLTFTNENLVKNIEGVINIQDSSILGTLWDNLFYQTVTQKDFYAKEAIIQLLITNHFVSKYNVNDFELAKKLLNAKVVLPKKLFVENKTIAPESNGIAKMIAEVDKITDTYPQEEMIKQQIIAQSEFQNEKLQKLKGELSSIEKAYQKEFNIALSTAEKNYQKLIKPILDQYKSDLENAKENWCSIKDPNVAYNPNDPCNQPPSISDPQIPEFEFTFMDPLDIKDLQSKLTTESFETLLELTGKYSETDEGGTKGRIIEPTVLTLSNEYNSLEDLTNHIDTNISSNHEVITNNVTSSENTFVSVGGMLVPIFVPSPTTLFGFQLCSKPINKIISEPSFIRYNSDLSISVPDATWNVANFEYTLERTDVNYSNNGLNSYTISRTGNTIFLKNIVIGLPRLIDESLLVSFTGKITFSNGIVKTFLIPEFKLSQCSSGILKDVLLDVGGDDPINTTVGNEAPFIPSGFGVKQLGIADYNKVEQTTLGYIEGDVAHIENIMAREYKDRSTRKLRKSENTFTSSSETEAEKLTDTSSTSRYEMQDEVAKVIANSKDFSASTFVDASFSKIRFGANANYATNNSKEESTRQALTEAQEITEKALDRIISKVKEERIEKIVEEFEENNSHGFDNRKGDKHVIGVFRWVDKLFKNQIINYGKRLMFEFMVPQPAKLHILGMSENEQQTSLLVEPTDPRKSITNNLADYSKITDLTLRYWASKYNVEIEPCPKQHVSISKGFNGNYNSTGYFTTGNDEIVIPEGYEVNSALAGVAFDFHPNGMEGSGISINIGDKYYNKQWFTHFNQQSIPFNNLGGIQQKLAVAYKAFDCGTFSMSVVAKCELTNEAKQKWQQKTFKAIIDAYENALTNYNEKVATEKATGIQIKGTNPGFYREFENKILRKNCISYLIDQNPNAKNTYGKNNLFKIMGGSAVTTFGNTEVNVSQELDNYAAFVKFMEQAFEWEIMSYNLYPYYWGNRSDWASLYQYDESNDPLFRNFMQAGMARVVVTVRPGFEEAVRYYMQTGLIWNGGEVPIIEDELYLSLVEELKSPNGEKLGRAWHSRVPTALTILQAQSIGLNVTKALPFNDDLTDFEHPEDVPQSSEIGFNYAELGGNTITKTAQLVGNIEGNQGIESKILLKRIDGIIQDITYCDINGKWELNHLPAGKYELFLDANDDFSEGTFIVIQGSKEQVVKLEDDQTIEIQLVVKKL